MRTFSARPATVEHPWTLIDAEGIVLGRLAATVASRLRGKHRPYFTPHVDCGDHVVVVNADKIQLTGRKREDKIYYWHTGYPGGIKSRRAVQVLEGKHPERVVRMAVQRMLPDGPLARQQFAKLRVYAGPSHPHEAQAPAPFDLRAANPKNARAE